MDGLQVYRTTAADWKPSGVVALAASPAGDRVAAAREDGSVEVWRVSPGSVAWHCLMTIQGSSGARVSSLVWCRSVLRSGGGADRLLSSSIDGSIYEWDLFTLQQKIVLDSLGVSIWQMAVEPFDISLHSERKGSQVVVNRDVDSDGYVDSSGSDADDDCDAVHSGSGSLRLAIACDNGCVRLYNVLDADKLHYGRSFPRVSGRILSVAWSSDANLIFCGSSNGLIRCWNSTSFREVYCITVGLGGLGDKLELCIWSLLYLRCGTLVSGDSSGNVQYWDAQNGTLLQAHTYHKGDVNALATVPGHHRVFSAGSDGQVILYKLCNDTLPQDNDGLATEDINKWVYVGYVRAHTHDIRALAVAAPISKEDPFYNKKMAKLHRREKLTKFSYHKWARLGLPMLISAGDDAKLYAYSAKEFSQFSPHDMCPAPQRVSVQLVSNAVVDGASLLLVQSACWLDVLLVKLGNNTATNVPFGKTAMTQLLVRLKSKGSHKIICSTMSSTGVLFAYSDHVKPCLFEIKKLKVGKSGWSVNKVQLPQGLQGAYFMVFSADSSRLMLAGRDRKIHVVDVNRSEIVETFVPQRKEDDMKSTCSEPPIIKLISSSDGKWLAATNYFGDIYIYNLEINRQHWFISRLNGASVTAGSFSPKIRNMLVIITSSSQIYVFDVEAKELHEWSRHNTLLLPRMFQDFSGEVIGLSFPPERTNSVVIYSPRAMCTIEFELPININEGELPNGPFLSTDKNDSLKNSKVKRKRNDSGHESEAKKKDNLDFRAFKDPVLFVGHLSQKSLLVLEKQWMDVVQTLDAPVDRHIFGT